MVKQLNDITVVVNNEIVSYIADSLAWVDGFGEYTMRNAIVGGGQTETVFSKALETKKGMVKFSMPTTAKHEDWKRQWKLLENENVVELIGPVGSGFTKVFTAAAVLNDPESSSANEGNIEIEFNSNPAR